MQLPNRDTSYIPSAKLVGYLLSESHAVGQSKAKFFRAVGFDEDNVEVLEQELLMIARLERVKDVVSTPFGTKYVIDGTLQTPKRGPVIVRTVWIVESGEDSPRFVTAYPA